MEIEINPKIAALLIQDLQNAGLNYALENITDRVSTADVIAALSG